MHEEDNEVQGLSQVMKYTITAIVLVIVTALEVLVLYPPLISAPDGFKIATLGFLGVGKFVVVVALFMHLWHDAPILTGIFSLGMVIGAGTLVALLALFNYYPLPENAVKSPTYQEVIELRQKERSEGADYPTEHGFVPWNQISGVTTAA